MCIVCGVWLWFVFFFQAEDGIRDLVRSRGLGDVYKRQGDHGDDRQGDGQGAVDRVLGVHQLGRRTTHHGLGAGDRRGQACLLYTSDAADERSSVDLGGRRII